MAFPCAYSGHQ